VLTVPTRLRYLWQFVIKVAEVVQSVLCKARKRGISSHLPITSSWFGVQHKGTSLLKNNELTGNVRLRIHFSKGSSVRIRLRLAVHVDSMECVCVCVYMCVSVYVSVCVFVCVYVYIYIVLFEKSFSCLEN